MKRKVDVTLLGRRFTVKTEKDDTYVHTLAAHVSRRLDEIRRQVRGASVEEQALLVAMHLADELSEERERAAVLRAEVRARTQVMVDKMSAALSSAPIAGPTDRDHDRGDGEDAPVAVAALSRSV